MSIKFNENVMFLQSQDFDQQGNLIPTADKPVVVMILASWCGHCKNAKPVFQELADSENGKSVYTAVIYSDGPTPQEKELSKKLGKLVPGFRGFPTIVKFRNGKYEETFDGSRNLTAFKNFARK